MVREREPERPVVNVMGERVALGPLQRDLLPAYQRWSNDLAAVDRLGSLPRPVTLEGQTAWYDQETTQITFTIYERATWRAIGGCSLIEVDHRSGTARLVILIGEADARGQGYGTEAVRLLLDIAFTALGLHNVMLGVCEFNRAGRRAYEKAGFRECGRRRQGCRLGGRRWDEIFMDCLATEFTALYLGASLSPTTRGPERPGTRRHSCVADNGVSRFRGFADKALDISGSFSLRMRPNGTTSVTPAVAPGRLLTRLVSAVASLYPGSTVPEG